MSDLFTEKAKEWDTNEMVRQLSAAVGSSILDNVSLNKSMHVMDFGAGTGLISAHVAPLVDKVFAVDTSTAMLEKLAAKPELQGKVVPICQDILDKPLNNQFDLVMSAMALHHVENTNKLVQRFTEHLKLGGIIALADLDKEDGTFHPEDVQGVFHHGFDRSALQAILESHGFEDIRFVTAHTVEREDNAFPIFLVTAIKH